MRNSNNEVTDCSVCNMTVDIRSYVMEYQGRSYAFCSQQCRDRFTSNPHLYVGRPGQPALKKQGHEIIKKRKLKLTETLSDEQIFVIETELMSMMGIKDIYMEVDCLFVSYDLLQATVEQVENAIEKTGNKLSQGLGETLRQAFIHYLEESEIDNLEQAGHNHRH